MKRAVVLLTLLYICITQTNITPPQNSLPINMFKSLNIQMTGNILFSPASLQLALALTANGAAADTQTQILKVLNPSNPNLDEVNNQSMNLMSLVNPTTPRKAKFTMANGIFTNVSPAAYFVKLARDSFQSTADKLVDEASVERWVSQRTGGRITDILDTPITPDIKMLLVSAAYFQSSWKNSFSADYMRNFLTPEGRWGRYFMTGRYMMNYYQSNTTKAVSIELQDDYVFDIIMPDNLEAFIGGLRSDTLSYIFNNMSMKDIHLSFPKFSFEFFGHLKFALQDLGMNKAFTESADFSTINPDGKLSLNDVFHKTSIRIDSNGVDTAATTVNTVATSLLAQRGQPIRFIVENPFIFTIRAKDGTLLFIGKMINPE
jgi:serine protease inhibitor